MDSLSNLRIGDDPLRKWMRALFGGKAARRGRARPQTTGDDVPQTPDTKAKWIPAAENPFGIDVVDCTAFCQSISSLTDDASVALSFSALRASLGEEHRGRSPSNAVTIQCDLSFPYDGQHKDGPLFKAQQMEEKWDIYLYDSQLYFARSWTGDLVFLANAAFNENRVRVNSILATSHATSSAEYVIGTVDYLMKSHLYRLPVPHPLPEGFSSDPDAIACWSFNAYGRYGAFASHQDTTHVTDTRTTQEPDDVA